MKVYIGPYISRVVSNIHENWLEWRYKKYSFQIQETDHWDDKVEKLEDVLQWVYDHSVNIIQDRREQKIKVKIHPYDHWSVDHTLAPVILPLLKQLKEHKHGSPYVDFEDVPEYMRTTNHEDEQCYPQTCFEFYREDSDNTEYDIHDRWSWVLDEMIWAFEQKCRDDWESDYYGEYIEGPDENGYQLIGGHFEWTDDEGRNKHQERMSNGFRLFGKYYESCWD